MPSTALKLTAASLAALALAACGGADVDTDVEAPRAVQPVASAPTYEPVQDVAGAVERADMDDDDTVELDVDMYEDDLDDDDLDAGDLDADAYDAPLYRDVTDYSLDPK